MAKKIVTNPNRNDMVLQRVKNTQKCGRYIIISMNLIQKKINCFFDMENFPLNDIETVRKLINQELDKAKSVKK